MWYKKFCRVWIIGIIFFVCVYYGVMIFISHLLFMDGEVAHYLENKEYSQYHKNYAKVLIMGDSVAKAGLEPKILGENVYNFALGGTSPVENYFYLREYIEKNEKPQTLILGFLPQHFRYGECFWSRSVYFHRINFCDLLELSFDVDKFNEENNRINKDNFAEECLSYYLYSFEKYGKAFKTLLNRKYRKRYKYNKAKYYSLKENFGQCYFGTAKECYKLNGETRLKTFVKSDLIEFYLNKLMELCLENDIRLIICSMPINKASYEALNDEYKRNYEKFLQKLSCKNENIVVETKICVFDNIYFGDPTHLNKKGSKLFSEKIKKKYFGDN